MSAVAVVGALAAAAAAAAAFDLGRTLPGTSTDSLPEAAAGSGFAGQYSYHQ